MLQAMVELPDCGCATNRGVLTVCMMKSFMSDISDCIPTTKFSNSSIFFCWLLIKHFSSHTSTSNVNGSEKNSLLLLLLFL